MGTPKETILQANFSKSQSRFILNADLSRYLEELHTIAFFLQMTKDLFGGDELLPADKIAMARDKMKDKRTLLAAINILSSKFEPF